MYETPREKFDRLTRPHSNYILPAPDIAIVHYDGTYARVEALEKKKSHEVIDFVQREKGGKWLLAYWRVIEGGEEAILDNPHQNNQGFWVWLLRKG